EPDLGRELVVTDRLGRTQPELAELVGPPALHVAAVEQRTAVVGDRQLDHARRRADAALLRVLVSGVARVLGLAGLAGLVVATDRSGTRTAREQPRGQSGVPPGTLQSTHATSWSHGSWSAPNWH